MRASEELAKVAYALEKEMSPAICKLTAPPNDRGTGDKVARIITDEGFGNGGHIDDWDYASHEQASRTNARLQTAMSYLQKHRAAENCNRRKRKP